MRKVYHSDEEQRETKRAYNQAYRETHHEALIAYDRDRHTTDEHRAKRRERNRVKSDKRRAQKLFDEMFAPVPLPITHKVCPSCDPPISKPVSEFGKCKDRKDGYNPYCKQCSCNKAHARLDKRREYEQERRRNPEYMQTSREKHTDWRHRNIDRIRERNRFRYATDPDYAAMMHKSALRWIQSHPMEMREHQMRRKSRMKGTLVGSVNYNRILERDGYHCYICEQPIDPRAKKKSSGSLSFDHVIPLIPRPGEPQGTHCEENLKVAHMGCNVRKSNRPFETLTPFDRRGIH